jgi:hypothetical protein
MIRYISFLLLCAFILSGCARSQAFKREALRDDIGDPAYENEQRMTKTKKFAAPKKRTLVLPFWNDTPLKGKFTRHGQVALRRMLRDEGGVSIFNDDKVSVKSQDFYLEKDKINVEELAKLGRKWAVSLVAVGRVSEITFRKADEEVGLLRPSQSRAAVEVEVRLIDIAGAKEAAVAQTVGVGRSSSLVIFGESAEENREARAELVSLAIEDGIRRAMPALRNEIDRVSWRGRIAKIVGGKIFVNAGRATGLNLGDILKVTTSGADVYDPESGIFLGRTEGEIKGTLEVVDYFAEDGAVAKVHSGGNFQESDMVQLYP